jgi:hypothetical protein
MVMDSRAGWFCVRAIYTSFRRLPPKVSAAEVSGRHQTLTALRRGGFA